MKIAKSGRKYESIPDNFDIEEWDKMTVVERMKAKGLIKEKPKDRLYIDVDQEFVYEGAVFKFTKSKSGSNILNRVGYTQPSFSVDIIPLNNKTDNNENN